MKLSELAFNKIAKWSKQTLNIIYSEYIWQDRYEEWILDIQDLRVDGLAVNWFYKPDFNKERQQYEVKCIDSVFGSEIW